MPLLWTPVQVAALRGTPTHAAVLSRSKFVASAHEALFPGGGGVPLDAFAWALSSVLSRAASGAGMPYTLMPGIDLLNHGGDRANCALGATRTDGFGGGGGGGGGDGSGEGGEGSDGGGVRVDTGFGDIEAGYRALRVHSHQQSKSPPSLVACFKGASHPPMSDRTHHAAYTSVEPITS